MEAYYKIGHHKNRKDVFAEAFIFGLLFYMIRKDENNMFNQQQGSDSYLHR